MPHLLDFIPASSCKKTLFPLLILTLVLLGVFQLLDTPLRNPVAPSGIVSFELAGTPNEADAIIQRSARAQLFILWHILIGSATDFSPQLAAYSATIKFSLIFLGLGFVFVGWSWKVER